MTTKPNTTTAQQSGPSDAAIAQAFRNYRRGADETDSPHVAKFLDSILKKAAEIDARQLQAAGGEGADLYRVGDMDGGYAYFHTRAEALSHGHDPVPYFLHPKPAGGFGSLVRKHQPRKF